MALSYLKTQVSAKSRFYFFISGHAMRAGENPPQGTVLGKALGELSEGTGVIYVLVMLQ